MIATTDAADNIDSMRSIHAASTDTMLSSSGRWIEPEKLNDPDYEGRSESEFSLDGNLYTEFLTLRGKIPNISHELLWDYTESRDESAQANEFFAELTTVVLINPALARQLIPNSTRAFERVLAKAAANLGSLPPRLGDNWIEYSRLPRPKEVTSAPTEPVSARSLDELLEDTDEAGNPDLTVAEASPRGRPHVRQRQCIP